MLEITYNNDTFKFNSIDKETLSFLETLLRSQEKFYIKITNSPQKVIESLQELCKTLNISLEISEQSEPEAVAEVIKVLGGAALGGIHGGVYGFVFHYAWENLGLEVLLENMFGGVDIVIPGFSTVVTTATFASAVTNAVIAYYTLKKVGVKVHFQESQSGNYKGLLLEFHGE